MFSFRPRLVEVHGRNRRTVVWSSFLPAVAVNQLVASSSIFEAARTSPESAFRLLPQPFDHARVVVAVTEVMVECGEAVLLASVFHVVQLPVKLGHLDVSPVVG